MAKRIISFGVIGAGLMGREFASAAARWFHLLDLDFEPRIVAVSDPNPAALEWFGRLSNPPQQLTADYHELLANSRVEAVYCAVPHNLHAGIYTDILKAGKHLLGEKPFGIDLKANQAILKEIGKHPELLVRCSSEFPFTPGAYRIYKWAMEGRFGRIIEMEAGFWHSSDLDPRKGINWKRQIAINGEYGCMGDLGMHVVHLPARFGWKPENVRALLSKVVKERPDKSGKLVPCETWDNAILACEAREGEQQFPMMLSTKRIAPGQGNTWFIRIYGTDFSAEYSTKQPKQLATLPYTPGAEQAWQVLDLPYQTAYPTITGSIFEFGFSDAILQMWAAFCDELVNGKDMRQPMQCATPEETLVSHQLFTAALESQRLVSTVKVQ
jgi:predicted dehydrogenase